MAHISNLIVYATKSNTEMHWLCFTFEERYVAIFSFSAKAKIKPLATNPENECRASFWFISSSLDCLAHPHENSRKTTLINQSQEFFLLLWWRAAARPCWIPCWCLFTLTLSAVCMNVSECVGCARHRCAFITTTLSFLNFAITGTLLPFRMNMFHVLFKYIIYTVYK